MSFDWCCRCRCKTTYDCMPGYTFPAPVWVAVPHGWPNDNCEQCVNLGAVYEADTTGGVGFFEYADWNWCSFEDYSYHLGVWASIQCIAGKCRIYVQIYIFIYWHGCPQGWVKYGFWKEFDEPSDTYEVPYSSFRDARYGPDVPLPCAVEGGPSSVTLHILEPTTTSTTTSSTTTPPP